MKKMLDRIRKAEWIDTLWVKMAEKRAETLSRKIQRMQLTLDNWDAIRQQQMRDFDLQVQHRREDLAVKLRIEELNLRRELMEEEHQLSLIVRDVATLTGDVATLTGGVE